MKIIKLPAGANAFDGAKFAKRYSLDSLKGDFYVEGGTLYYPDSLPDPATIVLEACDPLPVRPDAAIAAVKAGTGTNAEALTILSYLIKIGRV